MNVIVVRPNGKFRDVDIPENGDREQLAALQKLVNGSIEAVFLSDDFHVYFNEEGKLRSYWPNKVATAFISEYVEGFGTYDEIAGDMIILEHDHRGGERSVTNPGQIAEVLEELGGVRDE